MTFKYLTLSFIAGLLFFGVAFISSCQGGKTENERSKSVFSKEEQKTIGELITYFDSIVRTAYPGVTDIDSAYGLYLDSVCPLILKNGDMGISGINIKTRNKLLDRYKGTTLDEIFMIGDTLEYFSLSEKKKVKRYHPHFVKINEKGAYMDLLDELSENNEFIGKYYEELRKSGDLSPVCYGMMLRNYKRLDFTDPMQRLLFIVNVLHANQVIKDKFKP